MISNGACVMDRCRRSMDPRHGRCSTAAALNRRAQPPPHSLAELRLEDEVLDDGASLCEHLPLILYLTAEEAQTLNRPLLRIDRSREARLQCLQFLRRDLRVLFATFVETFVETFDGAAVLAELGAAPIAMLGACLPPPLPTTLLDRNPRSRDINLYIYIYIYNICC